MKPLLSYWCMPWRMIRLLAVVGLRRSLLPHLVPAVVAYPGPFQFALVVPQLWQVSHDTGFPLP